MKEKREYQRCIRCVMDTTDPDIEFDELGVCNHCREAEEQLPKYQYEQEFSYEFFRIGKEIRSKSQNKKYDCVIGLSGGVDSSYVAYLAVKKLNLKPLAIHFDNGWNSDLSIKNIEKIVNKIGIDLYTYVVDWEEFKQLQRAFLKSSVIDLELLTDQAIAAATYKIARNHKIKFSLTGSNYVTEHGMPQQWYKSPKQDVRNIRDIGKRFEDVKIKDYPTLGLIKHKLLHKLQLSYKSIPILNYTNYKREKAKQILINELSWEDYGGKHHESFLTKFYQQYILPVKFNVDKRKVHLSAMIRNNEISREKAINILDSKPYDEKKIENQIEYFIKKLGFNRNEFEEILKDTPVSHYKFKSDLDVLSFLRKYKV